VKLLNHVLLASLIGFRMAAQDPEPAQPVQPVAVQPQPQPAPADEAPAEAPAPAPLPNAVPPPAVSPPAASTPATPAATIPTPAPATNRAAGSAPRGPALPRGFPRANAAGTNAAATPPAFPTLPGSLGRAGGPGAVPPPGQPTVPPPAGGGKTNDVAVKLDDEGSFLSFSKMPLDQFLKDIYQPACGRVVLRGQNLPQQTPIDLNIPEGLTLNAEERLQIYDTILALNGVTTIPTGEKAVLAVPANQAMQEGGAFSNKEGSDYSEASQFVTHVVQLTHVEMQDAVDTVKQFSKNPNGIIGIPTTKTLVLRDYAINVKRMLEVLKKIDVEMERDWELEVIPIRYGRVEDISATMNSVISGGGGGGGAGTGGALGTGTGAALGQGARMNTGFGSSRSGSFGSGGRGFGRGGGGYNSGYGGGFGSGSFYGNGYTPFSEETLQLEDEGRLSPQQSTVTPVGTAAGTQRTTFQQRLNQTRRNGQNGQIEALVTDAQITADPRSNSLIVYASKKDMAMIKKVLEKVDTLLPQVLVEGIVMNVALNNDFSFGVAAGQRPKQFNDTIKGGGVVNNGGSSNPLQGALGFLGTNKVSYPSAGGVGYLAQLGQSWDVAISAIAGDGRADVVQRPRIITSHAVPAEFFVGSSIPYRQGGFSFSGQNNFYYQQLPVGIGLNVTPYITPDNLVVMEIGQNIDAVDGTPDPSSEIPPTTSNKSANAIVTVRSGDVVLLGGFLENNKTSSNSGVPVLKDIPLLGNLFKRKSETGKRSELMILVRPTILPKPSDLANLTNQQRENSGNIQELERRANEDDEKSLKAAEKARKRTSSKRW
jgi:general secretion pathway protein D